MERDESRGGADGAVPYPVYGDGAGVGVGSASEEAVGAAKPCCGGCASGARCEDPPSLVTGGALEGREAARGDAFADPLAPAAAPLVAAPEHHAVPPVPVAPRPSPFALPAGGCDDAQCEGSVRARDLMVHFVRTGATWPALRAPGRS